MTESSHGPHTSRDLLASYHHDNRRYHELLDPHGNVRERWRGVLAGIERSDAVQMRARSEFVARQIRENGVTYNVYADTKGTDRPWELDLLPQVIDADEWQYLAAGIAQRAALLDGILRDLYGPQNLLAEGLLPPELVFGNTSFLGSSQGVRPPGDIFLHVYAADLARAPDGSWWILADRTQAPSGAGYAVENRQIISRAFPDLFHELHVQDLSGFMRTLQNTLQNFSPVAVGETPLSVLLTPGRFNETYFEHVYLARLLGMPLVEGQDLTVRADTVYMKTLGGLKRVHAILRRVDDDFCDPLELRGDSALGVPGLAAAARAGRVLIANALGSGVIESPGLLGFLPGICEKLRGEPLAIPSVATWWCGEPSVCEEALDELQRLVVKGAFPSRRIEPIFGPSLNRAPLAELRQRIAARPECWVAQEIIDLSLAPAWQSTTTQMHIVPRAVSLRVFAAANGNGEYTVMPGGLARIATRAGARMVSMQRGGGSKDTWVFGNGSARADLLAQRVIGARDVIRKDEFLPSRMIENLFWVGRYSERSDDFTRLLRVVLARYIDTASTTSNSLEIALAACRRVKLVDGSAGTRESLLSALTDASAPYSLASVLDHLLYAASQVRGRLSQENWRGLMEVQRETRKLDPSTLELGDAMELLNRLLMEVSALSGFALDDMTRDDGWRFLMIGRRMERLQFMAEVFACVLHANQSPDAATLEWLLELADSTITYRMRYLSAPQLIPVIDLIVCDPANPHAMRFQVHELHLHLRALDDAFGSSPITAEFDAMAAQLEACDLSSLEPSLFGTSLQSDAIHGFAMMLGDIAGRTRRAADALAFRHFVHVDAASRATLS